MNRPPFFSRNDLRSNTIRTRFPVTPIPEINSSMKKNTFWNRFAIGSAALVIGLGLLSGCRSVLDNPIPDDTDGFLQLEFSMPATRAEIDGNGAGSFSDGDRIGLFIDNGEEIISQELTFNGGEWSPKLNRRDLGTGRLTLSASYSGGGPAMPGTDPKQLEFEVQTDQHTAAGYEASDLLLSQAVLDPGDNRAELVFRHAMHRLRIELIGQADGAEISVNSRTRGTVDLTTGSTSLSDEEFQWITPAKTADGYFEAVIFPQPAAPFRDGDRCLLRITVQDNTYDFKAPEKQSGGSALEEFMAGQQLTVKLTLKESGDSGESGGDPEVPADQDWANKKVWVYGINPPQEGAWKQFFSNATTYYLQVDPSYGWYDCNKLNPSAQTGGVPDGMMCWAAVDANLLHWWIDQNKEYIKLYNDYKGPNPVFDYEKDKNGQGSAIFQHYINTFADEAGYIDAGANWFIHGTMSDLPTQDYYNPGGYFKDVFPAGVTLGENVAGLGKEVFNKAVKEALSGKKALGISRGSVKSSHAMTVWGAEFDDNGDVSYIYVCDNNDRDNYNYYGFGCCRYQIVYEKYPEGATYTAYKTGYIPNGDPSITINRLVTLDLGQEYWKEFLKL